MPKLSHVPGLSARRLKDGTTRWHWKPTPRQRRLGWASVALGADLVAATAAAIARNDEVDRYLQRGAAPASSASRPRTFREGIAAYKADVAFTGLKPKTRAEYASRLRTIERWADDGQLPIRHLTKDMCVELRNALVKDARPFRTAAILRVLRLLCAWFEGQQLMAGNPAAALDVPEPPKRRHRLVRDQLAPLVAQAQSLGHHHVALGITLGFYTMQREGDLLEANAFRLRALADISAGARRALAGDDGKVMALVFEQGKTGTPVSIPLIPLARAAVDGALEAKGGAGAQIADAHLFMKGGRRVSDKTLQRDFRATCNAAAAAAADVGDDVLAAAYRDLQFRDLRRSGMCWMREMGVPTPLIATISGHSIEKTQKILDTYMPRDSYGAAEAMAMALTRQADRDAADAAERGAM